jgi:hypothetical protein
VSAVPWQPHAYQRRAVAFLVARGAAGLFLDPGLGKTSITLAAYQALARAGVARRMLVVAPLRPAYEVWPAEAAKWREFAGLRVTVLHGSRKDRLLEEPADVFVVNPEGLGWLTAAVQEKRFKLPDVLVVDESTYFKHTRTLRSKLLRALLPRFRRRYILTGTPAPNGILDLFGQVYLLDLGDALGRFISHFRQAYFFQTGFGGFQWTPLPGAEEKIYARLQPLVLRLDAADYLAIPPLRVVDMTVTLPPRARAVYQRLEREFAVLLASGEVTAVNAAVAAMKLRQVVNGSVYLDAEVRRFDGPIAKRRVAVIHAAKAEALAELLEELSGQPLLVAYEFDHDLPAIASAAEVPLEDLAVIGGKTTPTRTRELLRAWDAGELRVLAVHPASAAHGLNLQAGGTHLCWYGLTWNLEHYDQLIRRLWRQGQARRVTVHRLVVRDSIDEAVLAALGAKARTQRHLLDALRAYVRRPRKKG